MDQDKALKKALETMEKGDLPYGFEMGMMNQIMLEVKKKKRHSFILNICLVSSVSIAMIVGTILLITDYLKVKIVVPSLHVHFAPEAGRMFGFFFYIAFLVLVLLGLDHYFRSLRQKHKH